MLNKSDIDKIRKVFREEIESEVNDVKIDLGARILENKLILSSDINDLKGKVKNLEMSHKDDMGYIKKQLAKFGKDLKNGIIHLDNHFTRRINKIEENLNTS